MSERVDTQLEAESSCNFPEPVRCSASRGGRNVHLTGQERSSCPLNKAEFSKG